MVERPEQQPRGRKRPIATPTNRGPSSWIASWLSAIGLSLFEPSRRRRYPQKPLSQRLDRAAEEINPVLTIIMIGLVILNLIAVAARVTHRPVGYRYLSNSACSLGTMAACSNAGMARNGLPSVPAPFGN